MTLLLISERMEDGRWCAEIPECPGVWCDGDTRTEAEDGIAEVLRAWWQLKVSDGDDDLPSSTWTFVVGASLGEET